VGFLQTHFPDGQLRELTVHVDEESVHMHFAVAVWNEKVSQNRGRQRLLQPSANPLLADYEHAQDLAIIDRDTWDAAQARKTSRSKAHSHGRRDRTPKRPFSGLLRCGKCGGGMSTHDRSGSAIRIRCSTARESGSCNNDKRYRLDKIEHAVLEKLKAELADPIYVKEYLKAYYDERRTLIRETERNRSSIEKELTETQGRLARLVDLYTRGVIDGPAAEKDIAEATVKRKALEARLVEQEEPEVVELHPATLERYFETIDTLIRKLTDLNPQFDRELVETLHKIIAKITVFPATDQGVTIEVTGWLQSLIGVVPDHVGE
jgi:hypothetical protein